MMGSSYWPLTMMEEESLSHRRSQGLAVPPSKWVQECSDQLRDSRHHLGQDHHHRPRTHLHPINFDSSLGEPSRVAVRPHHHS